MAKDIKSFPESKVAQTVSENWAVPSDGYFMAQKESGSMNYKSRKDATRKRDASKLRSSEMNMDGYK